MKQLFIISCCVLLFNACSKKNDQPVVTGPVMPTTPDTLSAGWSKVGDIPNSESMTDVFFTDISNGYATSTLGIYKSSNGGVNWNKINTDPDFINIAAIGTKATFVNQDSYFYNTQNNGATILKTLLPPFPGSSGYVLYDCFYSSANICYMCSRRFIFKSMNGGISFDTIFRFSTDFYTIENLFFVNDQEGWATKGDTLYKTMDGGLSWNHSLKLIPNYSPLFFPNRNIGYVSSADKLYKTSNAGNTWQILPTIETNYQIKDMHFVSDLIGYCCIRNRIYKTIDGGTSWTKVVALGGKNLIEIHFIDENHGWACGEFGYVLRFNQ
jgi:photosystem II stability/assembly factor-like uncharacterized protein